MKLVLSSLLLLAVAVTSEAAPRRAVRGTAGVKVSISAKLSGGATVQANAAGLTSLTGSGTLGAGTASYSLKVTGGSIKQGRFVSLVGAIIAGGKTTTFQLDGDRVTGTVRLTYKGAKGDTIMLNGSGSVSITTS